MILNSSKKIVFVSLFLLLLLPLFASAAITSGSTAATASRATTGTDVTVTATLLSDSGSTTASQIQLTGTGRSTGTSITVRDPAVGYYSGTSVSSSGTSVTFVISSSTVDTFDYRVQATYSGGSYSTTDAVIEFVAPSAVSVTGDISNRSNIVGQNFTITMDLNNPSAMNNVTTSYALSYSSSGFTVLSGDPTTSTITIQPSQTTRLSWIVNASGAVVSSPIRLSIGDTTNAYSNTVTNTAGDSNAPVVTLSSPAASATLTSSTGTFTFSFTDSDSTGAATCRLWIDSTSITTGSVAEGATGSFTGTGLSSGSHTWLVQCTDGASNSANSSSRTFTVSLGGTTTAAVTTTAAAATTTAAVSAPTAAPTAKVTETAAGEKVLKEETKTLDAASEVTGSFAENSATFTLSYTAPAGGFSGELTYKLPFDYADYTANKIKFDPEPTKVAPGSILATWDVELASGEAFTAKVDVAEKVASTVLQQFQAPKTKAVKPPTATIAPPEATPPTVEKATATPAAPKPAAVDNTLLYIIGAIIILGALYFLVFAKKK